MVGAVALNGPRRTLEGKRPYRMRSADERRPYKKSGNKARRPGSHLTRKLICPMFSPAEKFELTAIPVVTAAVAWLAPRPGATLEAGELIAGAALLILVQGFFRDLWLLRQARRQSAAAPAREARCMCVESALGMTGIVAGIGLVGLGFTRSIVLNPLVLAAAVFAAMAVGFLLKDFVFEWAPWKIYREKDHAQVIFRWRK